MCGIPRKAKKNIPVHPPHLVVMLHRLMNQRRRRRGARSSPGYRWSPLPPRGGRLIPVG